MTHSDLLPDQFWPYWKSDNADGHVWVFSNKVDTIAGYLFQLKRLGIPCWSYSEMLTAKFATPITYAECKQLWHDCPEVITLQMKQGADNANHPDHPLNKDKLKKPIPLCEEDGGNNPPKYPCPTMGGMLIDTIPTSKTPQELTEMQEAFIEKTSSIQGMGSIDIQKGLDKLKEIEEDINKHLNSPSTPMSEQQMTGEKITKMLMWCKKYPSQIAMLIDKAIKHLENLHPDLKKGRTWKNLSAFAMSASFAEKDAFDVWYNWVEQEVQNLKDNEGTVKPQQNFIEEVVEEEPIPTDLTKLEHFQLQAILQILTARTSAGFTPPLWLYGSPGAGKTHLGQSLATKLGLKHYPIAMGPTTTETKIVGYRNLINGDFVEGCVYQPYKMGGIWQPDEIDATDPGVLVSCNALLANDQYMFPNGELVKRHKDFIVLATANTIGTGSVHGFQRNRLDAATLDRFVKFRLHYDTRLERILSGNREWTDYVCKCRTFVEKHCKESIYITPRASINGAALLKAGMPPNLVADVTIFNGISESIAANIKQGVGIFAPKKK